MRDTRLLPTALAMLLALPGPALGAPPRAVQAPAGTEQDLRGFPRPAGLVLTSYSDDKRSPRDQQVANYHSAADADSVLADYRRELSGAGWQETSRSDSGTGFHRVIMSDWKATGREAELRLYPSRKEGTDVWARVNTYAAAAAAASSALAAGVAPSTTSAVLVVPSVLGKAPKDAEWFLRGSGFAVSWAQPRTRLAGPGEAGDTVDAQDPAAGRRAARGSTVTLTATQSMARVPNLIGLTSWNAEQELGQRHLRMRAGPAQATADPAKAGTVAATQPAAGETARRESEVAVSCWELSGPIPDVRGRTVDDATAILKGRPGALRLAVVQTPPVAMTGPGQAPGRVATQDPPAGTVVMSGATVTLTAWDRDVPVPDLVGRRYAPPGDALGHIGPGMNLVIRVGPPQPTTDPRKAGTVAAQDPAAGRRVVNGSEVAISVWTLSGPVPNVVGKTYADAAQALRAGPGGTPKFVAAPAVGGTTMDRSASSRVASQDPAAGASALDGAVVTLTSPALIQRVPDVVGGSADGAQAELTRLHYQVAIAPARPTVDPANDGVVAAQAPPGGTALAAGETVTLTVYRVHPSE